MSIGETILYEKGRKIGDHKKNVNHSSLFLFIVTNHTFILPFALHKLL